MQGNQPLDKGRIMAAVEYYQAKENGQPLVNQDGSPKMKPKWWPIGEATKWQGDKGPYTKEKIYCQPLASGPYEQRTFWDSESQNNQQAPTAGMQHTGYQQAPQVTHAAPPPGHPQNNQQAPQQNFQQPR